MSALFWLGSKATAVNMTVPQTPAKLRKDHHQIVVGHDAQDLGTQRWDFVSVFLPEETV